MKERFDYPSIDRVAGVVTEGNVVTLMIWDTSRNQNTNMFVCVYADDARKLADALNRAADEVSL